MKVIINGIEYVPKADRIEPATPEAQRKALVAMLWALYLHQKPERGVHGAMWEVVEAMAPGLAEAHAHDPERMLTVLGERDRAP